MADWGKVVFSDETKINRFRSDGRLWVWKKTSQHLDPRCVEGTIKFGGGNIMVWGCMLGTKLGTLHRIHNRMTANGYIEILNTSFMENLAKFGVTKENIIMQQDRDPKHTAKITMKWFQENNIEVLDWPPQSPDMNIIGHVWSLVKRKLTQYATDPKSLDELWHRTKGIWESIKDTELQNIFESLPRRIKNCISAKVTKY